MAAVHATEVRKLAALEDQHWWYRERRHLLATSVRGLTPGTALDVGAAGGGNTRVLRELGWHASALEYGQAGAVIAHERGLPAVRGDMTALPFTDAALDLVVAFDVLEHIEDDASAAAEARRVLRHDGRLLIAVPADPRLWSAHDEAVGHVRRYTRSTLAEVLDKAGFDLVSLTSWNVLLRPVVRMRRKSSSGSDLEELHPVVNAGLRAIITAERFLPVDGLPGVSLVAKARPR
jgi:SAM-dependent methyltransferase